MWPLTLLFFFFFSPQNNLNLLLTEEEMYSLTETFQQCKVIPGKAGWCCWMERGWADFSIILFRMKGMSWNLGVKG